MNIWQIILIVPVYAVWYAAAGWVTYQIWKGR